MGLGSFLTKAKRMFTVSKKPSKREIWLTIKIATLGFLFIGIIGFAVKLVFTIVTGQGSLG